MEDFENKKLNACASVILEVALGLPAAKKYGDEYARELEATIGLGWNFVVALQYLSGKKAKALIDKQEPIGRPSLLMAHLIAKEVCATNGLGNVELPDNLDRIDFENACKRLGRYPIQNLQI